MNYWVRFVIFLPLALTAPDGRGSVCGLLGAEGVTPEPGSWVRFVISGTWHLGTLARHRSWLSSVTTRGEVAAFEALCPVSWKGYAGFESWDLVSGRFLGGIDNDYFDWSLAPESPVLSTTVRPRIFDTGEPFEPPDRLRSPPQR